MQSMQIRQAGWADIPLILQYIRELAEYEGLLHEVVATEELLAHWLFDEQRAKVLLGEENGRPVGFALYFYNFSTFLGRAGIYLEDLYVRPAFRGRGYGKKLLQALAKIAVAEGCGRLEWWCLDSNQPSIAFYQSMGAIPMEDWTVYRITGETLKKLGAE